MSYVRYVEKDGKYYVHSRCHAEMRKSVTYLFDVCVDRNAVIVECQCECRAGMGPDAHSKHVRTVLWALIYHGDGQALLTEETCTQRLQFMS